LAQAPQRGFARLLLRGCRLPRSSGDAASGAHEAGAMGASSCGQQKSDDCPTNCCNAQKWAGTDMLPEYEPNGKAEAQRESVELPPPTAIALKEHGTAREAQGGCGFSYDSHGPPMQGNNYADSNVLQQIDEGTSESYFARELQELRNLPSTGPSGPRPLHTFKTGATYLGEWKGNARHGLGEQTWPDGAKFRGHWNLNFAEGPGQFIHADGDVFTGQWHSNAAQGLGIYEHKHGMTTYGGQWVEDLQHGHGIEIWEGGSKYRGQFFWGKKQGDGVYEWPDGSKYSGQWKANSINGVGHYVGKDGREFKGSWKEAVIHGCGQYSWPDGRMFWGQYADDQKEGFGVFTWKDGRKFEGYWKNGKQHGHGVTYNPHRGVIKQGVWNNGQQPETPEEAPEAPSQRPPLAREDM